ncbi:S8 family serine peptidase [Metapseudomonas lalkuanensis]|uniref:S8 family serine peptidase n=1 Tax=Metapseudomonas lalkuanensis TaxID=2604832 RepID=A0A5J6QLI6_9GAMM|nr:S8 family serine peptidase [Pseudomonas lalkuanensis]QEY63364.1 S8 family serine peptidase [Pseudomonas lalkuanensis]
MQILDRSIALGILLTSGYGMAASGDDEKILTVRAVSEPSPEIAQLIDKIAQPVIVRVASGVTFRELIVRQCGGVTESYIELIKDKPEFKKSGLDGPLEEGEIPLPACLYYFKPFDAARVTVRTGDTAYGLYRMKTGGGGTESELVEFFGEPIEDLSKLKPGKELPIAAVSLPVSLPIRPGSEALIEEFRRIDPQGLTVREARSVEGEIVMGMSTGEIAASDDCETPSAPMNAKAVYEAYRFSKELSEDEDINVDGGRANIAIVDNGFFGALSNTPADKAFDGSPFRRKYFKADSEYTLAQVIRLDKVLQPINYSYGLKPDLESGHGTHVTGIVLGGPDLEPYFDRMRSEPWASIAIINIGLGARSLIKGSHELLLAQLRDDNRYRVVNLSITHDGLLDRNVRNNYQNLFSLAENTLFVVAAGNDVGKDVVDKAIIPAALGGAGVPNVITVAAIDGKHKLTKFSNVGQNAVDMAAPGCEVRSWISNSKEIVAMSGTSQATPAVTNEAALQLSLAINAKAATLKNRAISSGDLLPESERGKTVYEVSANPVRSLFLFKDYLDVQDGDSVRSLLGEIVNMPPLTCLVAHGKARKKVEDMFSIKRAEGKSYFFGGMGIGRIQPPCLVVDEGQAGISFVATHEVLSTGEVVKMGTPLEKVWPVERVINFVARTPIDELR